jgi:hypothetical protein
LFQKRTVQFIKRKWFLTIYQNFIGQANFQQGTNGTASQNVEATEGSLLMVKPSFYFNLLTFESGGSLRQFAARASRPSIILNFP